MVSNWTDKRVLVTGATGLIGGWLTKDLIAKNADIIALVREQPYKSMFYSEKMNERVTVVPGKLENVLEMERIIEEFEIETIFHLGAQTQVTIANKYPFSTFESNVRGTYALLDAVRRSSGKPSVVVASSDKAYGSHEKLPYTEEFALKGENPYDCSKSAVDLISQSYAKTYGMNVTISRCGNFFGGGDLNWNRIVPGTIRSVIRKQKPIIRSDGKFIRDYIYVKDAVSSYLTLAEAMESKKIAGEAFNFSTENQMNVIDVVNLILKLMKSNLKPEIQNKASNEIRAQHLSCEKARRVLNWKAQYSFESGLKETISWYENMLGGKQ